MTYKLLKEFQGLFAGTKYKHRDSSLGDRVASFLFEDIYYLGRSPKYQAAATSQDRVLNALNRTVGKKARRGDATFGVKVPHILAVIIPNHAIALGEVAAIEIGAEVKIMSKSMIKQLDRVSGDLIKQVTEFKKHGGNPICVGIVGINRAAAYTSYEGRRRFPTDGKKNKHPAQEADQAESRLVANVQSYFDELIVLRFSAANIRPYDFSWTNEAQTEKEYASVLVRICREYETRF